MICEMEFRISDLTTSLKMMIFHKAATHRSDKNALKQFFKSEIRNPQFATASSPIRAADAPGSPIAHHVPHLGQHRRIPPGDSN